MIITRMRNLKQPKYPEKAYNKLKFIVTFSSVNNIKSRSRTKCMARSYLTFFVRNVTISLPLSSLRQILFIYFLCIFFLNERMFLQYNIKNICCQRVWTVTPKLFLARWYLEEQQQPIIIIIR